MVTSISTLLTVLLDKHEGHENKNDHYDKIFPKLKYVLVSFMANSDIVAYY